MGVKNLWDILESCKKTLPLHHLQNKRVCVDLSCWMVQLQNVNKSHCPMKDKLYLKGLFHRLRALIALNCSLIFVTDGSIPAIKLSTYRRRLNAGDEAILDARNPHKVASVKRNMGSEFSCMIKEARSLGIALGIPCLDGIEEAEAQCALLNSESLCDGCFSSDSDAFLFGARTVYRDICLGEGGYVICYEMDDIERELGFGRNSLITLAILLGSDYTQGIRGFGPESACQIVKSIGDSSILQRFASEGLSIAKKRKSSKKNRQASTCEYKENNADKRDVNGECVLPMDNEFLQVINAYVKPKCHSADSDAVHRVLALYPFNRSQLHQICAQFFDWPPEKTDGYILPKIAERNLRRFANLHSTSLELGVHLPISEWSCGTTDKGFNVPLDFMTVLYMNEETVNEFTGILLHESVRIPVKHLWLEKVVPNMPVKCPISSIVKQRKFHGRDYFEVSWEDMDGLEASAVPADLVESACPEKILEFQKRKAQKQKPTGRSRKKKVDMKAEMKEIDRKLQELLLDIEKESTTVSHAVSLGGLVPEKSPTITNFDMDDERVHFNTELESSNGGVSNGGSSCSACYATASRGLETEIIDLISPSPRARTHEVSKCQEARCVDVIELSDTDNDVSPEHARKVRELRLFMAKIKR